MNQHRLIPDLKGHISANFWIEKMTELLIQNFNRANTEHFNLENQNLI